MNDFELTVPDLYVKCDSQLGQETQPIRERANSHALLIRTQSQRFGTFEGNMVEMNTPLDNTPLDNTLLQKM